MVPGIRKLFLCLLLWLPALPVLAESFVVTDIRVEGLQRISAGTVFNYIPVKIGDAIDTGATPEIIRSLYKSGFFKDVRLEREDGVLVVFVQERPAIAEINISGNKSIETENLMQGLKDIGLQEGRTFNRSVLDKIEQELRRQFFNSGKYAVKLESTVTPLERNRVSIDITISEGETARIKKINVVGNQAFEEDDLLEDFQLGPAAWYDFLSKKDQYSRQKLAADLETLRSYYLDRGYINFKVDSTQVTITPDKQDIYVTVNISEGEVFHINDIKLAGEFVIAKEEMFPLIHLARGEVFSRRKTVNSADRINQKLADLGYAFANVNSIPEIDEDKKTVAVTFFVDPGKRVYVRQIDISGNDRTRDRVIRREMRQMESGWFSSEKLKLSRERLDRLGFFDEVSVETPAVPGTTDQVDIKVKVKEKSSGALLAGIGYSQSQGILFNSSINESNFLGTGKKVGLAFNNSVVSTRYQISYLNPYYTINGISRGFNLRYQTVDFEELDSADYSTNTTLAGMTFGIPLSEFNRISFTAEAEKIDFTIGSTASTEVQAFVNNNGDSYTNFKLSTGWSHDSRDKAIFPTRGGIQSLSGEVALPGSDLTYYKLSYSHRRYFPLNDTFTFSLNGDVGYGESYGDTTRLPFYENFFAGGSGSVRGFSDNSLGPRDSSDDPLGGNARLLANAELYFPAPIGSIGDTARMSTFLDIGNVYDTSDDGLDVSNLRYSAGVGVSWLSPMGALTVSMAYPLKKETGDDTEVFQFNFGSTF